MDICGTNKALPSVPRSKGCTTCVSRKTRCDGRRPTCHTCERRGDVCGGYRRDQIVFLGDAYRALGVASQNPAKKQRRTSPQADTERRRRRGLIRAGQEEESVHADLSSAHSGTPQLASPHIAFLRASFGTRPLQALGSISHLFDHYLNLLASTPHADAQTPATPVVLAVDALAHCHYGTAHGQSSSIQHGLRSYGKAIETMSAKLDDMMLEGDAGLQYMSEEDWQHFAFFCLVMAFYEMKMSPESRNWENHVRCLATAIDRRGTRHAWSETNFRLLASSRLLLTLQSLSAREPNEWYQYSPVRAAWMDEVRSALGQAEQPRLGSAYDKYDSLDSLMIGVTTVASVMARFDQLIKGFSPSGLPVDKEHHTVLFDLYTIAESVLSRNEAGLSIWNHHVSEVSRSDYVSAHPHISSDTTSNQVFAALNEPAVRSDFETLLTFRSLMEYNSITTYWTIIISLRLLLSDMLVLMVRTKSSKVPLEAQKRIYEHRIQLMGYALRVLRTTCFATHTENHAAAPFAFVAAFQLTVAVLDRESHFLGVTEPDRELQLHRYQGLKAVAIHYLDWAMTNKIPVKIDMDSPPKWRFGPMEHHDRNPPVGTVS